MAISNADRSFSRRTVLAALGAAGIGASLAPLPLLARQTSAATPKSGVSPETLVSVVLDSALLAVPEGVAVSGHLIDQPGWSQTISFPETSAAIVHVAAGAYTVRSDGPVVVVRPSVDGAGIAETILPGNEAVAKAGETMLLLSSSRTEESNRGDTPTERYTFVVVRSDEPTIEDAQGTSDGELLATIEADQWSTLPSGPVTITFTLVDAASSPAATPDTALQMSGALAGPTSRQLVIAVSPGALPGATPVDLAMN